jgi:hypothetical protein
MIFLSRPGQIVEPGNKPHHGDETGPQPVDDHGRPVAVLGFLAPAAGKSRDLKCIDERGRMRASPNGYSPIIRTATSFLFASRVMALKENGRANGAKPSWFVQDKIMRVSEVAFS